VDDSYRLLHLSDIHFGQERDGSGPLHEDVRRELIADAGRRAKELGRADRIIVTGDVGFSGLVGEFDRAGAWLEDLCNVIGCARELVFVVPGNHDVNRRDLGVVKRFHDDVRRGGEEDVDGRLASYYDDQNAQDILLRKLENYRRFAERYGCGFESCRDARVVVPLKKRGLPNIRLIGLNSVLISDQDDKKGQLVLGKGQYIFDRDPTEIDIVLLHHPLSWLKDEGRARDYLYSRARLILTGHEHDFRVEKKTNLDDFERLEISAGATNPQGGEAGYEFRYHWLLLSVADGGSTLVVNLYPRIWRRGATNFDADTTLLGGRESKAFRLSLSSKPDSKPTSATTPPTRATSETSRPMAPIQDTDDRWRRLRFLYWKELNQTQRLRVMVKLGILPDVPDQLTMLLERKALAIAEQQRKLHRFWDAVMEERAPKPQEVNPFTPTE
jgi:predicted MPP superfamily phosphohydrolase